MRSRYAVLPATDDRARTGPADALQRCCTMSGSLQTSPLLPAVAWQGLRQVHVLQSLTDERLAELAAQGRSEEHTPELQSPCHLVCRLLLENTQTGSCLCSVH